MIHSAACTYAIRALARLATVPEGEAMKLREIARVEAIPGPFLSGILPRLVDAGVLESLRGPTGGYRLARPAERITLHDLVEVVDGLEVLEACAAGLGRCSDAVPCPLHDHWKPIRERVRGYLRRTTVADMAQALAVKRASLPGLRETGALKGGRAGEGSGLRLDHPDTTEGSQGGRGAGP